MQVHNADVDAFLGQADVDGDKCVDCDELAELLAGVDDRRTEGKKERRAMLERKRQRELAQLRRARKADVAAGKAIERGRRVEIQGGIAGRGGTMGGSL